MALFGLFGGSQDDAPRGGQLDRWIEETLKRELKLDQVERDDDGDIPVRWGSAMVFISTVGVDTELPLIRVFSPLLEDFTMKPEVYEALNSINRQTPFAKAVVDPENRQIELAAELFVFDQLSPEQLMATIELIGEHADRFDTMLQKRFGGEIFFDDDDDGEFHV
jgi:hypothetical protein